MIRKEPPAPLPAESLASLRFDASDVAPAAARARVLERVEANLAAGVTASDPSPGLSPGPSPGFVASTSGLARLGAKVLGQIAARSTRLAVVAFALGAASGAALHAWFQRPRADHVVYVDRAVPQPVVAPAPAMVSAAPHSDVADTAPSEAPASNPLTRSLQPGGARNLAAERALLDRVQRALRAGDVAGAQRALDAHARRFPTGILAEEREALAIKTLVAAGRRREAQKRAAMFRERFPDGLFRSSVDEAVESIR